MARATVHVVLNPAGIKELQTGPGARALTEGKAEEIAAVVRRTAPYDPNLTVHYRDNVEVEPAYVPGGSRVFVNVPYAHKIEVKYRTLGSAIGDGAPLSAPAKKRSHHAGH